MEETIRMMKVEEYKKREMLDKSGFMVPKNIDVQKMKDRYRWLRNQIGESGIRCRLFWKTPFLPVLPEFSHIDHFDVMENKLDGEYTFYIVGVTKSLRLNIHLDSQPCIDYSSPTEVLRAICNDHQIHSIGIDGWKVFGAFCQGNVLDPPQWIQLCHVIPEDYRA